MKVPIPLDHISPTRYYSRTVELTFLQALKRFVKHWQWSWYKVEFDAVYKGDPRYDAAPYEETIIRMDEVWNCKI